MRKNKYSLHKDIYRSKTFEITVTKLFHSVEKGYTVDAGSMILKADVIMVKSNAFLRIYI